MGRTITEKIFAQHVGQEVLAGDIVVSPVDFLVSHDANRPQPIQVFRELNGERVADPSKLAFFLDHAPTSPNTNAAAAHAALRAFSAEQGTLLYDVGEGICHQLVPEQGLVVPGDLVIGTDSHTCTYGALNLLATGVGSADLAVAMKTGKLWFKVPRTIRIVVDGALRPGVFAKDLILHLVGLLGPDGANYCAVEFVGPAIEALDMESRLTITNMAIEMGAKFGIMEADEKTAAWVRERTSRAFTTYTSDPEADFLREYRVDASTLEPQVARPPNPANAVPIDELVGTPIQQATIGTCTNGRLSDLREAASILRGQRLAPGVRLFVTAASRTIYREALREGLIETFVEAGAVIGVPGCSGCTGGSGMGIPGDGENMITTANRNYAGRTGNPRAFIYLASPATVMASAIEGCIADPRPHLSATGLAPGAAGC
jgi:3-isopropylmalate/(R)-2-methylmalate dehydratase large subunit